MTTTNALTNVEGIWIGDGSTGCELEQEGPSLTIKSATRGTPFNVCYDGPISATGAGDWCFEVVLVHIAKNSSVSIGVVNPEELKPGWKTKGMFYNGNLTNGSAALVTSFGPYLKEGDSVGVAVTNNNRDVTFYHDGRCLGMGFSLTEKKAFCPCIHASGEVQISFAIPTTLPTAVSKQGKTDGMVDEWKLVEAVNESGTAVTFPENHDIVLHLDTPNETQYQLSLRVGNTLRCSATKDKGDSVKVGPIMSTMMEPPPELREIETFLSSSLPSVTSIDLKEASVLVLSGSSSQMKLVFERYVKNFKPLNHYSN